jgi:MtN3 and saliva related transmembrane protein
MEPVTVLGLCAAFCTSVAFLPQVVRNFRRRSAGDLSLVSFSVFSLGVLLWLGYGIVLNDLPIILSNVFTLSVNLINLGQVVWYRRHPRAPEHIG